MLANPSIETDQLPGWYYAQVVTALQPLNGELRKLWGHTLFHLEDVAGPSGALGPQGIKGMPDIFTPFKEKVNNWHAKFGLGKG